MRRSVLAALLALVVLTWPAEAQLFPPSFPGSDPAPAAQQAAVPSPDFSSFAGAWARHGFGLTINADGSADAGWRVYAWCGDPGVVPPCDGKADPVTHFLTNGGQATMHFDRVDGPTAFGVVTDSTVLKSFPKGPVTFTLQDYGMGELQHPDTGQRGAPLCGPHFPEAPEWFRQTFPCGA